MVELQPVKNRLHLIKGSNIWNSCFLCKRTCLIKPSADILRNMRIRAGGNEFTAELPVEFQHVKPPAGIILPCGGIDLYALAPLYKELEYLLKEFF